MFPKRKDDDRAVVSQLGANRRCLKQIEPTQHDHGIPMLSRSNFMRQPGRELVPSRLRGHLFDRGFGGAQLKVNRPTKWVVRLITILYSYSTPSKHQASLCMCRVGGTYPCSPGFSGVRVRRFLRRTQRGSYHTTLCQLSLRVAVSAPALSK